MNSLGDDNTQPINATDCVESEIVKEAEIIQLDESQRQSLEKDLHSFDDSSPLGTAAICNLIGKGTDATHETLPAPVQINDINLVASGEADGQTSKKFQQDDQIPSILGQNGESGTEKDNLSFHASPRPLCGTMADPAMKRADETLPEITRNDKQDNVGVDGTIVSETCQPIRQGSVEGSSVVRSDMCTPLSLEMVNGDSKTGGESVKDLPKAESNMSKSKAIIVEKLPVDPHQNGDTAERKMTTCSGKVCNDITRTEKSKMKNSTGKHWSKSHEDTVNISILFNARHLRQAPVKIILDRVFKGDVKFRLGKTQKKGKILITNITLNGLDEAKKAICLMRKRNHPTIIEFNIESEDASELNYELQRKCVDVLEPHDKKINSKAHELKMLFPSKFTKCTKAGLKDKFHLQKVLAQELSELVRQREEFIQFMLSVRDKLVGSVDLQHSEALLIRQAFTIESCRLHHALPVYARRGDFINTVMSHQVCIVLGETGSGKSTQLVQYLHQTGFTQNGIIACTQPRKVAAVSLARRVSEEMLVQEGDVVGHQIGCRGKFGPKTKILYMTDYTMLLECVKDSELSKYSCIVIDEAHERSLYSDIVLGMLKQLLARRRDLRLIISSATMDTDLFKTYFEKFDAKVMLISGRTFPVDVAYPPRSWKGLSKFPTTDAVDKVREVHRLEGNGDILVFLPTPADTEKACELMSANKPEDRDLECLPLHGKLHAHEQQKVCKPSTSKKRRVIFATNIAETSVTIPGIKFVIDTGLVKENKYDPIRNMSTLEVCHTSRSSVEQRKGRAGRTQAGKCFRLFSEEDHRNMKASSNPEILQLQLGHAILSLMSAGVVDPLKFDFVESPGVDALKVAMEDLVSLGAVVDGELTELGRKISKLKLGPRLGKLVINGLEDGVGMEALVVASVCTITGSLFFRIGSNEEKDKADLRKLPFCHVDGDLLTCLEVFRQWLKVQEREKSKWCFRNSINNKTIRIIKETQMDLLRNLEMELGIKIDRSFQNDTESADKKIQRAIFDCFNLNLCRYGGHNCIGYLSCLNNGNQAGVVHPSSALRFLDQKPKWLVYDSILNTSQKFIMNVTVVEEEWVMERIEAGELSINLQAIGEKVLERTRMVEFGYQVMNVLTENRYARLSTLEKQLTIQCENKVILEIERSAGLLNIIARKDHFDFIRDAIRGVVGPKIQSIKDQEIQEPLNQTSTRLVFSNGYDVNCILLEGEYRSVVVKVVEESIFSFSEDEVLACLESFGSIKNNFTFNNRRRRQDPTEPIRWGKVTFSSREEAAAAVHGTKGKSVLAVPDLHLHNNRRGNHAEYAMKFRYCRRPSKEAGFVNFESIEDSILVCNGLEVFRIGQSVASLKRDQRDENCTKLYINDIDKDATEEDLTTAVHEAIHLNVGDQVKIAEVVLYRKRSFDTTHADKEAFRLNLQQEIDQRLPGRCRGKFRINLRDVKPGHIYILGSIFFDTLEVFEKTARNFPGGRKKRLRSFDQPFEVTHHISSTFSVPTEMYGVIQPCFKEVDQILAQLSKGKTNVTNNSSQNDPVVRIQLSSEDAQSHKTAIKFYQDVLEGDPILSHSPLMNFIFTPDGEKRMKEIMKQSGAYLRLDKRSKCLTIYGMEAARKEAKTHLNSFLDEFEDNKPKDILLQGGNQPKGLMKKVVQTYGCDLETIRARPGITAAVFDMRKKMLKIRGNDEALDLVSQHIEDIANQMADTSEAEKEEISCSVCFKDFKKDFKNMYRLQVCGHAYCLECIKCQIEHAQTNKEFPIMCCGEDCQEAMTFPDIWKVFPKGHPYHAKLQIGSLEAFVTKNRLEYQFCPTPECDGVYRVSNDEEVVGEFRCESCHCVTCTCCHKQHPGMTCMDFKGLDENKLVLEKWRNEKPERRKFCPKCKAPIEKKSGCNHMTCSGCKVEFCWLCLATFRTSGACYDHLSAVHQGFGL